MLSLSYTLERVMNAKWISVSHGRIFANTLKIVIIELYKSIGKFRRPGDKTHFPEKYI